VLIRPMKGIGGSGSSTRSKEQDLDLVRGSICLSFFDTMIILFSVGSSYMRDTKTVSCIVQN
jgi:hypothetical protein